MQQQQNIPLIKNLTLQDLKSILIQNQHPQERGYYTINQWGIQRTALPILNTWRILKLINFGDDYVPTGLVYDTLITLLDNKKTTNQIQNLLKNIFFKYIELNGKFLSQKEKQQLAFFKNIRSVTEGYKQILNGNTSQIDINQQQDRNSQLYRLHNVFTYKKNLQSLKKIEQQSKVCVFKPQLHPRTQYVKSKYMQIKQSPKPNDNSSFDPHLVIDQNQQLGDSFRARRIPFYPEVQTKGNIQFLARMQKSRQMKRINSFKPFHLNNQNITPFTLQERDDIRKQTKINNNFKLLFIIKAQVGKKIYRIKVRQCMSIQQVVKNIQKLVGFKDSALYDIVVGYFKNYEIRQKKKNKTIHDQSY